MARARPAPTSGQNRAITRSRPRRTRTVRHGGDGRIRAGRGPTQAVPPDRGRRHQRRERPQRAGQSGRAHDEQHEQGRAQEVEGETPPQSARGTHRLGATHFDPVHGHHAGIAGHPVPAEGEGQGAAHLPEVDVPYAPAQRGLDPAVHLPPAGLDGHLDRARREAGQANARGRAAPVHGEGELQPRAVLRPPEHRLPAPREPVPFPPRPEPARERPVARPDVHEQGARAFEASDEGGKAQGPDHGDEESEAVPGRRHAALTLASP